MEPNHGSAALGREYPERALIAEQAAAAPVEERYADAPNRAVAYLFDSVLLAAASLVAATVASLVAGPVVRFETGGAVSVDRTMALVDGLLATALSAAYFAGSWTFFARTLGMRLIGSRISTEDGSPLRGRWALVRWAVLCGPLAVAAVATPYLPGVGDLAVDCLVVAWLAVLAASVARSRTKQGLHDRLTGSLLVKRTPVGRPPWSSEEEQPSS